LNAPVALAARLGWSLDGANVLTTRGHKTGKARTSPVNPLEHDGQRYLVAPRGETFWVRNIRAAGEADLQLGRRKQHITVEEIAEADRPQLIAAYLERWGKITRTQFGTVNEPDQPELERLAARTPVFRITQAA
jgi:deazaflavin-dependent oxidoreductase (nitroreductase family)